MAKFPDHLHRTVSCPDPACGAPIVVQLTLQPAARQLAELHAVVNVVADLTPVTAHLDERHGVSSSA
jgi:hypothetical protein